MNLTIISAILRSLAAAAGMSDVFGKNAARLSPILDTLAAFTALPDVTRPAQEALRAMVDTWVAENRGPTDAELDSLKADRDSLDAQLRQIQADLSTPPNGGL